MPLPGATGFTIDRETYKLAHPRLGTHRQALEVEVGDIDETGGFRPDLTIRRWNNHARFRLGMPRNADPEVVEVVQSDQISWRQGDLEGRYYDKPNFPGRHGGFEFEIILHSKPANNRIDLPIRKSPNVHMYYQGTVQEEIDDIVARGGVALDPQSIGRPVNVIHSYAVYLNARHGRFRSGKLCHIYRPEAVDALGVRQWCRFADNAESTGVLRIIIPQPFLNTATYPITIDPTFGYSSAGATSFNHSASEKRLSTPTSGGGTDDSTGALSGDQVITGLHGYFREVTSTGTNEAKMAIYVAPPGTPDPTSSHTLTGSESSVETISGTTATQYDFDATPTMLDGVSYVAVGMTSCTTNWKCAAMYDTGTWPDCNYDLDNGSFTMPSDLVGAVDATAFRFSFWADYAPASSAGPEFVLAQTRAAMLKRAGRVSAIDVDLTHSLKTGKITAVDIDLTHALKTGKLTAVDIDLTHSLKTGKLTAIDVDLVHSLKTGKLTAVDIDLTYALKTGKLTAVDVDLEYTTTASGIELVLAMTRLAMLRRAARITAIDVDLTHSLKTGKLTALDIDLTHSLKTGKLTAVDVDLTHSLKTGKLTAIDVDLVHALKTGKITAVDVDLIHALKTGKITALDIDFGYFEERGRLTALEVILTYIAGEDPDGTRVWIANRGQRLVRSTKPTTLGG